MFCFPTRWRTEVTFLKIKDGVKMKFITQKKDHLGEYLVTKTNGLDVHVMNKLSLSRFIDGGSGV